MAESRLAFAIHLSAPPGALLGTPADAADSVRAAVAAVLAFADRTGLLVALAAENLAWRAAPLGLLRDAVEEGRISLLLTHAGNAHAAYLTPAAAGREVQANRALLATLFPGAAADVVLPPGLGFDTAAAAAYREAGARAVVVPLEGIAEAVPGLAAVAAPPAWLEAWPRAAAAGDPGVWAAAVREGAGVQVVFLRGGEGAAWLERIPAPTPVHEARAAAPVTAALPEVFAPLPVTEPLVRWDGLYPPPGARVAAAPGDEPAKLYARHPFILFQAGAPLNRLLQCIAAAFPTLELGPFLRAAAHADLWGPAWQPAGVAAAGRVASAFAAQVREGLNAGHIAEGAARVPTAAVAALRASLGFLLDNPVSAAEAAAHDSSERARVTFAAVREHRLRAAEGLMRLEQAVAVLPRTPGAWYRVADMLDVAGREIAAAAGLFAVRQAEYPVQAAPQASAMASVYPPQVAVLLDRFFAPAPLRPLTALPHAPGDERPGRGAP